MYGSGSLVYCEVKQCVWYCFCCVFFCWIWFGEGEKGMFFGYLSVLYLVCECGELFGVLYVVVGIQMQKFGYCYGLFVVGEFGG